MAVTIYQTEYILEDVRKTYNKVFYIKPFGYQLQSLETMVLFIILEQCWESILNFILKFKPQNCDKCDMYYIYCLRVFVLCIELPTCFTLFRLANLTGAISNTIEVQNQQFQCFYETKLFEVLVLYFEIRVWLVIMTWAQYVFSI